MAGAVGTERGGRNWMMQGLVEIKITFVFSLDNWEAMGKF